MWIVNRGGTKIVNTAVCKQILISNNNILADDSLIGSYNSEEKAIDVLARIIEGFSIELPVFIMPVEATDIENAPDIEGDTDEQ